MEGWKVELKLCMCLLVKTRVSTVSWGRWIWRGPWRENPRGFAWVCVGIHTFFITPRDISSTRWTTRTHYACELAGTLALLWMICRQLKFTQRKQATIHQLPTSLTTSKNVLFSGHNHLLTTGADDLTLWSLSVASEGDNQSEES